MERYLIPSLENIKALYDEVVPMMRKLKTKEDVINFGHKHKVTMEINYDFAEDYDEKSGPIKVIRCESWGDLDYIYVYKLEHEDRVAFDVWCDFLECDFIDSTNLENLEKDYIRGVKWIWNNTRLKDDDRYDIVDILKHHGISYDSMVKDYGFDEMFIRSIERMG